MSGRDTKFPKKAVPNRSHHQATTIIGKNGLVVDALASIEPGTFLIQPVASGISYSAPTVTVAGSVDLSNIVAFVPTKGEHTGSLLFSDSDGANFFIDLSSVNNTTKTFDIYTSTSYSTSPTAIILTSGWSISEAELVNRLQTTSAAVIDNIEFRDVEVNIDLDGVGGDSVRIVDSDGDELDINPDGSLPISVDVELTDLDNYPQTGDTHDAVRVGDGVTRLQFPAANSPDAGNSVKVGARYDETLPTYDDGDRTNLQADKNGRLIVAAESTDVGNIGVITGLSMNTAGTEYSFALPTGTKWINMRSRMRGLLKYAYQAGGTISNFITVSPGVTREIKKVNIAAGQTLYVASSKNLDTLEIEYWI